MNWYEHFIGIIKLYISIPIINPSRAAIIIMFIIFFSSIFSPSIYHSFFLLSVIVLCLLWILWILYYYISSDPLLLFGILRRLLSILHRPLLRLWVVWLVLLIIYSLYIYDLVFGRGLCFFTAKIIYIRVVYRFILVNFI